MSDELDRAAGEYLAAVRQKFQEDFPDVSADRQAFGDAQKVVQQSLDVGAANHYDLYRRAGEVARAKHHDRLERDREAQQTRDIINDMRRSRGQEPL